MGRRSTQRGLPPSRLAASWRSPFVSLGSRTLVETVRLLGGERLQNLVHGRRSQPSPRGTTSSSRILVIRLDAVGDVVITSCLFREMRNAHPAAWITVVVQPLCRELLDFCPYVDEVLTLESTYSRLRSEPARVLRTLRFARRHLRRTRFDIAVIPRWGSDTYHATIMAFLSRAEVRVGFSEMVSPTKQIKNKGFDKLLTHPINDPTLKHEVRHNLDVLRSLGTEPVSDALEVWIEPRDKEHASSLLATMSGAGPVVVLSPGAGHAKRRWPPDRFLEVARMLQEEFDARLILIGGPGEQAIGRDIHRSLDGRLTNSAGTATLRQSAALIQLGDLFIGNDSGPKHIASALGVPTVEISCHPITGSDESDNSPIRFGAWGNRSAVVQPRQALAPCNSECVAGDAHCILDVAVEDVFRVSSGSLE
jgi:ADP-heptose:LPS heptosyltransferase